MNAAQRTVVTAVDLSIDGMTCASCAHRIEKKLNKLDGVTATVNFATEKAHVQYGNEVTPEQLVATVEDAGYQAHLPAAPLEAAADEDPIASLRQRLLISAVLTVPVIAHGHGAGAAVHLLAVAVPGTRGAGRDLGRMAVPPGGVGEPQARQRNDGHAYLDGHAGGTGLVGLRAVLGHRRHAGDEACVRIDDRAHRRNRQHLPRSRGGSDHVHPCRPLLRGSGQTSRGSSTGGAAGTRRQGCLGAQRWCRTTRSDRQVVGRR